MNPSLLLLSAFMMISATILACFTFAQRPVKQTAEDEKSRLVFQRETRHHSSRTVLNSADVVKMTPQDWSNRFSQFPSEVSAEYAEEIVALSEELSMILLENPDTNSMEARAFCEAILTLLTEGRPQE